MHRARSELLPRAGLARNHDRQPRGRGTDDAFELLGELGRGSRDSCHDLRRCAIAIATLASVIAKYEERLADFDHIAIDELLPLRLPPIDPRTILRPEILEHPSAAKPR